jgi:hypothetical protein
MLTKTVLVVLSEYTTRNVKQSLPRCDLLRTFERVRRFCFRRSWHGNNVHISSNRMNDSGIGGHSFIFRIACIHSVIRTLIISSQSFIGSACCPDPYTQAARCPNPLPCTTESSFSSPISAKALALPIHIVPLVQ